MIFYLATKRKSVNAKSNFAYSKKPRRNAVPRNNVGKQRLVAVLKNRGDKQKHAVVLKNSANGKSKRLQIEMFPQPRTV